MCVSWTHSQISKEHTQKVCLQRSKEQEWRRRVMGTTNAVQKKQKSTLGAAAISMETKGRQQLSFSCTYTAIGPVVEVAMTTDWWRTWERLPGCLFCRSRPRQRWSVRHPGGCGAAEGCGQSEKNNKSEASFIRKVMNSWHLMNFSSSWKILRCELIGFILGLYWMSFFYIAWLSIVKHD